MLPKEEYRGRVFDRFPSRDERRGNYLAEEILAPQEPRPRTWHADAVTDQGREGACVGHGVTLDLISSPRPDPYATDTKASEYAQSLYKRAQVLDPWAGEAYEGTSVDAGMKVARERGFIESWRWLTTVQQIRDALISKGPVVLGIPWYEEMYETRPSGLVHVGGSVVGGHCITLVGYHPSMRIRGEGWFDRYEVFKWQNSWGRDYGLNGIGYITVGDLATLLNDDGEAALAVGRKYVRI